MGAGIFLIFVCPHDETQKAREGCGCPKFLAGKVFWQSSTLPRWLPRLRERSWIFSSETTTAFLSFVSKSKKPFTRVSKPVPGVHGKRGLERGWQKGWQRVGEGLAKGWHRVGEGLARGWQVSLHPPTLQFPRRLFRRPP